MHGHVSVKRTETKLPRVYVHVPKPIGHILSHFGVSDKKNGVYLTWEEALFLSEFHGLKFDTTESSNTFPCPLCFSDEENNNETMNGFPHTWEMELNFFNTSPDHSFQTYSVTTETLYSLHFTLYSFRYIEI
jgi:tRNA-splicing endonuclease subunit sen54 N-term